MIILRKIFWDKVKSFENPSLVYKYFLRKYVLNYVKYFTKLKTQISN